MARSAGACAAALLLAAGVARAQSSASIRSTRPRLLFSAQSVAGRPPALADVQARLASSPTKEHFAALKATPTGTAAVANDALRFLLDPTDTGAADAAAAALASLPSAGLSTEQLFQAALAYDWLDGSAAFDASARSAAAAKLLALAQAELKGLTDAPAAHGVFDAAAFASVRAVVATAIALHGDEAAADALFDAALVYWRNGPGAALCFLSGTWHEGMEATADVALWQSELALEVGGATGQPLAADCAGAPQSLSTFALNHLLPSGGWVTVGDVGGGATDVQRRYKRAFDAAAHTAAARGDALLVSRAIAAAGGGYADADLFRAVLFDVAWADQPPLRVSAGFTRFGKGALDELVWRSGFDAEATVITFKSGDWFSERDHLDAGSFTVYHRGWLALDSGAVDGLGTPHREDYAYRSVAHNVVTVTHPGDVFPSPFPALPRVNDGGQRPPGIGADGFAPPLPRTLDAYRTQARLTPGLMYETAEVRRTFEDQGVSLVESDLTLAYDSNRFVQAPRPPRLTGYERTLVVVRGKYVLVQDRLALANAGDTVKFLLHTAAEPKRQGSAWVVENGGALGVRLLSPADADQLVVGGPGSEFRVDGQNFPSAVSPLPPSAGTHRLELAPKPGQTAQHLLTVVEIGDRAADLADLETLEGAAHDDVDVVRFGADVVVLGHALEDVKLARYTLASTAPLRHRLSGFTPNTPHLVAVDGLELDRFTSDATGSFAFDSEAGGHFFVKALEPAVGDAGLPGVDTCANGVCGGDDFGTCANGCCCTAAAGRAAGVGGALVMLLGLLFLRRKSA